MSGTAESEDQVSDKENDIPSEEKIESSVDPSAMEVCEGDEQSSEQFVPDSQLDSQLDNDTGKIVTHMHITY